MDKIRKLIVNLEKLNKELKSTEIHINPDDKGYIEKECPNVDCLFNFKVYAEDWSSKFDQEKVHCPKCNQVSPANTYYPRQFIDNIKNEIIKHTKERIFKGIAFPEKLIPYETSSAWNLSIQCEKCNTRFSVIGSAFYCPSCGFNSVESYFEEAMKKILVKLDSKDSLENQLTKIYEIDEAKILIRAIQESSLTDCVVCFQRFNSLVYERITGEYSKQNVFQRLEEASKLWEKAIGTGFQEWITENEYLLMKKLFQQRHLLQHTDGIVDQRYLDITDDDAFKIGERIIVDNTEIHDLVNIIIKAANKLRIYGA